ncbi:MAG: hypothetical protein JNL72_15880 [Flavipsychrobacter sp.]|nr:hypothetical protein [Flavipsychrobacter sp.]
MSRKNNRRQSPLKKLNSHYRLVFIDDESLEEVASFRLTLRKLYVLFSTVFVVVVTITVLLLLVTPLKYYIPGYGSNRTNIQILKLKKNVDSLSDLVAAQHLYEENIRNVINGKYYDGTPDTTKLDMNLVRKEAMSIFPKNEEIKKKAIEEVKKETPEHVRQDTTENGNTEQQQPQQ